MMANVPHVTTGLGLRKFQADGFLLTRVYVLYEGERNVLFFEDTLLEVFCVFRKEKLLSDRELRGTYGDNTMLEKTA